MKTILTTFIAVCLFSLCLFGCGDESKPAYDNSWLKQIPVDAPQKAARSPSKPLPDERLSREVGLYHPQAQAPAPYLVPVQAALYQTQLAVPVVYYTTTQVRYLQAAPTPRLVCGPNGCYFLTP